MRRTRRKKLLVWGAWILGVVSLASAVLIFLAGSMDALGLVTAIAAILTAAAFIVIAVATQRSKDDQPPG